MAEKLDERFQRLGVASSDASVNLSSAEDFEFSCHSCKTSGNHVEAVGYCVECAEYLCGSCIKYHFKNRILKQHVLLHLYRITDVSDISTDNKNRRRISQTVENKSSDFVSNEDIDNIIFLKSVNVKSGSDTENCKIIAIVVLSDKSLVVADLNNKCVKLIDCKNDVVKDTINLRNSPLSMSLLPHDQLAVTIGDDYIVNILSSRGALNVIKTIRVDGFCLDVVYFNGKLLISLKHPLMFEILDLKGKVLEKVIPGPDVTSLCTIPRHIALSPDEKTIFISDGKNEICLSLDMKGKKRAECKELGEPGGIVCSSKLPYIIVCDRDKHLVRKMTMDLQCGQILLNKSDGLLFPKALCVCPDQRYLIVGSMSAHAERRNNIKIFQF